MKTVTLHRFLLSDEGTFGQLKVDDLNLYSGELPWRDNQPEISCIPIGEYAIEYTFSPRFQRNLYLVKDVPGREGIRFHSANYMGDKSKGFISELNGCVALGMGLGFFRTQRCLTSSRQALEAFEKYLKHEPFVLKISSTF